MITYPQVQVAQLIERKNRFIAHCLIPEENREVVVHVKNTGRCKELLVPGVEVGISYQASATRKTDYDLISVKKAGRWINIDSQVPNQLAFEGVKSGEINLPGLKGEIELLKREVTFDRSRFDLYLETTANQKVIIEVKGMTLENQGIAAFPDAPTERGLKHVNELILLGEQGYIVYVLFIVQLSGVAVATIHEEMQPALQATIATGLSEHLQVIAQGCQVSAATIELAEKIPFVINQPFLDPNK